MLSSSPMGSGAPVLVVDDDMLVRWTLVNTLAGQFTVFQAETLDEARRLCASQPTGWAAVVVGRWLRDEDGLLFARDVRLSMPSCFVVVLTADTGEPVGTSTREIGAEFMAKPFDVESLRHRVTRGVEISATGRGGASSATT